MNTKRSIKHFFILPSYQLRLVVFLALVVIIGSVFHIIALNYFTARNLSEHFGPEQLEQIWETLKPSIVLTNSISCILLIVFLVVLAVLISHKLAGPMLKITGHVNRLSSGVLPKNDLKLREGDEGQQLCDAVNKVQNSIKIAYDKLNELRETTQDEAVKQKLSEVLDEIEVEK